MDYSYIRYLLGEAVNINKDSLLKAANGDTENVSRIKKDVSEFIDSIGVKIKDNVKQKIVNLVSYLTINGNYPKEIGNKMLHDCIVDGDFDTIFRLNSDSKKEDVIKIADEVKQKQNQKLTKEEEAIFKRVSVFHQFEDGFKWVIPVCEKGKKQGFIDQKITGKTMGHCGNHPSVQDGDVYYELRDSKDKPYLSVVINKEGHIVESKGKSNSIPNEDVKRYMQWLLLHPNVKGVKYGGYKPNQNYGPERMFDDKEFLKELEKEKPEALSRMTKFYMTYSKMLDDGEDKDVVIGKFLDDIRKESKSNDFILPLVYIFEIFGKNPFDDSMLLYFVGKDKHIIRELLVLNSFSDSLQSEVYKNYDLFEYTLKIIGEMKKEFLENFDYTELFKIDPRSVIEFCMGKNVSKIKEYLKNYVTKFNKTDDPVICSFIYKNSEKKKEIKELSMELFYDVTNYPNAKKMFSDDPDIEDIFLRIFNDESLYRQLIEIMRATKNSEIWKLLAKSKLNFDENYRSAKDRVLVFCHEYYDFCEYSKDKTIPESKDLIKIILGTDEYEKWIEILKTMDDKRSNKAKIFFGLMKNVNECFDIVNWLL